VNVGDPPHGAGGTVRLTLADLPTGPGRSTATLLDSLAARLATAHRMSGAELVGSLTAGYAALGRQVARTADGARMRAGIEASAVAAKGELLWRALGIDQLAADVGPTPVLRQFRNDLALALADDLDDVLESMASRRPAAGEGQSEPDDAPPGYIDHLLGLYAYAVEVVATVEALVEETRPAASTVRRGNGPAVLADGPLLR
jgi:hypothetical protein